MSIRRSARPVTQPNGRKVSQTDRMESAIRVISLSFTSLSLVRNHCPNLLPTTREKKARPKLRNAKTFTVNAHFGEKYHQDYESLATMWSEWNREYFDADFPRLFVRFEDTIFNAEKVMNIIADCAGLSVHQPYLGRLEPSKDHGNSSGLISAMVRYGTDAGRADGLLPNEITYANKQLDAELIRQFHYNKLKESSGPVEPP